MTKQLMDAAVLENKRIAKDIFRLDIDAQEVTKDALAGQFINVYLNDRSMLLPRPISICLMDKNILTLVYRVVGKGTEILSGYQRGEKIRISSGLGNGFQVEEMFLSPGNSSERTYGKEYTIALIGGGLGVPPLLELAKTIRKKIDDNKSRNIQENGGRQIKLIAVIGFQREAFLADSFNEFCDRIYLSTEDGWIGTKGNVMDVIREKDIQADYCLACGPKPMLKALASYCMANGVPLQVSMEERMGCGYGACVGCVCKTKKAGSGETERKKVCKDGPVFFGNEVVWDE